MNYCNSDTFRYLSCLLITSVLCCFTAWSQSDTIGYSEFRFTVLDVQNKQFTPEKITARISNILQTDTTRADDAYAVAKVEYSIKDSCWILSQYDPMGYTYVIEVFRNSDTVNLRLLELRKMTIEYHGYDQLTNSGCQFCICNNIPMQKGIYAIDIPKKPESWAFIKKSYYNIRSNPTEFRDITGIQNWVFRTGK